MKDVLIKWTGSKRLQSKYILPHLPKVINTYYEPFLGSGAMLYKVLTSKIKVSNYICSDINEHLISIWKYVIENPDNLSSEYENLWKNKGKKHYLEIRKRFNEQHNPVDFFFLLRTCRNGLVRFNSKGEFNSAYHFGRDGIKPDKMARIINHWSKLLQNVNIIKQDYQEVQSNQKDFIYIDPPYGHPKKGQIYYHDTFDYTELWQWLRKQTNYAMSLDGLQGTEDISLNVPEYLYNKKYLIPAGSNKLNQTKDVRDDICDSLYIKCDI